MNEAENIFHFATVRFANGGHFVRYEVIRFDRASSPGSSLGRGKAIRNGTGEAGKAFCSIELEFEFVLESEKMFDFGEFGPRILHNCATVHKMNFLQTKDLDERTQLSEVVAVLDNVVHWLQVR